MLAAAQDYPCQLVRLVCKWDRSLCHMMQQGMVMLFRKGHMASLQDMPVIHRRYHMGRKGLLLHMYHMAPGFHKGRTEQVLLHRFHNRNRLLLS